MASDYFRNMEKELVFVVSRNTKEGKHICNQMSKKLKRKGLNSYGPMTMKAPWPEAQNVVLKSNDPSEDKYGWLQDLVHDTILTLKEGNSTLVRGYLLKFQRRINYDAKDLLNSVEQCSNSTNIQISRNTEENENKTNPPFSYDPIQDFITEI